MVHQLLHKVLADAVVWGLISNNATALVDAPKRQQHELTLWTPEQVRRFLAATTEGVGGRYGPLHVFLLASGCRIGEALGLRWSDVDEAAGTVRIVRQVVDVDGEFIESAPKTRHGTRSLGLPDFGLRAITSQKRDGITPSDRIFVTEVGTTPSRSNVRRALGTMCERIGLPVLRIHDFRHLHISLLALNGVPVRVAQQRAGHSSPVITMATYTHVLGDADRLAVQGLEARLSGVHMEVRTANG